MVLLYGRAGRLTAKNGGFRPGQYEKDLEKRRVETQKNVTAVVWSAEDDMYIPKQTKEGDADAEPHEDMMTSRNYYRFSRGLNSCRR